MIVDELITFFNGKPLWLQDAARRIFTSESLTEKDLSELTEICKLEAGVPTVKPGALHSQPISREDIGAGSDTDTAVSSLLSISNLDGINALANNQEFKFRPSGITIFYGDNGTGKSGVSRVLKSICGAHRVPKIHPNVFIAVGNPPSCKVKYKKNTEEIDCTWKPEFPSIPDLQTISIFDADEASVYLTENNELTYEPPVLRRLTELGTCIEQVRLRIQAELDSLKSKKPTMPGTLANTDGWQWYASLNPQVTEISIEEQCRWSQIDATNLAAIERVMAEVDPTKKARDLDQRIRHLELFSERLLKAQNAASDEAYNTLKSLNDKIVSLEAASQEAANLVFSDNILDGVSSDTWKILWAAAKKYSESHAYPGKRFPVLGHNSRCVLCHQELDQNAQIRLTHFDNFVNNEINQSIILNKSALFKLDDKSKKTLEFNDLDSVLSACDIIANDEDVNLFKQLVKTFTERYKTFGFAESVSDLYPFDSFDYVSYLSERVKMAVIERNNYLKAAEGREKSNFTYQANMLRARSWLFDNKAAVIDEVNRVKKVEKLEEALRLTVGSSVTNKKKVLAGKLMGEAFVGRFNQYLKRLGGERLKIKINQTGEKTRVKYGFTLKDTFHNVRMSEVLSEGEFRIASLAAFLADTAVDGSMRPIIFDDPVSSLDHNFEHSVAECLSGLAEHRQIIIFTHRLTFLTALLNSAGKNANVHYLQKLGHTSGYHGAVPPNTAKAADLMAEIRNRIVSMRVAETGGDAVAYSEHREKACNYFRLAIERTIEAVLLRGMIDRFSTRLKTQTFMLQLAAIKQEDLEFLDSLMTTYSFPVHIQADEKPLIPIPIETLEQDLSRLATWSKDFGSRATAITQPKK